MKELKAWVRVSFRTKNLHPSKRRWEVIYTDPEHPTRPFGQRTKGGFHSKQAAQDWADDFLNRARSGTYTDPLKAEATFAEVAGQWLDVRNFERANTESHYRRIIEGNNDLMKRFGKVPIGDISHSAVARYVKDASATLAGQTVRHRFYALRAVLDYAVHERLIPVNPARSISPKTLPSPKDMHVHEEQRYPLTVAETERIIAAMPEPYDVFTRLVAYTGMRPEEAAALTLADFDPDEGTVYVRAVMVEAKGALVREDDTKTKLSRRLIDLDTRTLRELTAYVSEHRKRAAKWFSEHPEHDHPGKLLPLFVGVGVGGNQKRSALDRLDYSKPMRYSAFYKRHWHKATKAAGLPPIRFYDLRHADVSRHVDRLGQDGAFTIKEIQERYGHSSAVMTLDRYAHTGKPDRVARRRALDAVAVAEDTNVTPIASKWRSS